MDMRISHGNTQIIQRILEEHGAELRLFLDDKTVEHYKIKALVCAMLSEHYNVKTDGCTGIPEPHKPETCPDFKPKKRFSLWLAIKSFAQGVWATFK